ncbi:hypothetical protein HYT55_02385 [Candidatus Woesearchaeota archaeon]|nr:hypothetical protein [Candidatus Woesearchaeota archaeon]
MTWRDSEWYKSIDLQQHNPQFGDLVMYTARFTVLKPSRNYGSEETAEETDQLPLIPCPQKYCTLVRYNDIGIFGKFPRKRRLEAGKQTFESDYLSPCAYSFTLDSIISIGGLPVPYFKFNPAEKYSGEGSQKLFLIRPFGYIENNYKWIVGKKKILDYLDVPALHIFIPFIERIDAT